MTITNALFSIFSCTVEIDGVTCDIASKASLLKAGLCNVNTDNEALRDELEVAASPEDNGLYFCPDVVLVCLAMRYFDWCNDGTKNAWPDEAAPIPDESEAAAFAVDWISRNADL